MTRTLRRPMVVLVCLASLAGCTRPTGPIVGEWRGQSPGASPNAPKTVDITLNGMADAASGNYCFTSLETDPTLLSGHDQNEWGGTWVRSQRVVNGQPVTIFRLKALLSGEIDTYALEPDRTLRPVDNRSGLPDVTPAGFLYSLSPVSTRNAC